MQLPLCFLHSSLLLLLLRDSLVVFLPFRLYSQSFFLHKWIYSELASILFVHVIDNIPLALVTHSYAYFCYCCCCWCSLGCLLL